MSHVNLKNIRKNFGAVNVIKGIDLEIAKGEFMVFVGPSGCGKSTLLRLIAGLEDISDGELCFDGARVNEKVPSARGISMVFQSYALYPHMKVYDNMAFGLKLAKSSTETIEERVLAAAKMLELDQLLDRLPRELSGGQRQRVAIGRAIVRNPSVFLFDEPLSNLDAALRSSTRLEIAKLHQDLSGVTMIYVTHDQIEAMTLADRICVLRDGQIEQVGTPSEIYDRPKSVFVAGFIGSPKMNLLRGDAAQRFGCATVGIRAEHFDVNPDEPTWSGLVKFIENLGSDTYLFVDVGLNDPLVVRQSQGARFAVGDMVGLAPSEPHIYRFGPDDRLIT